MLLRCFGILRNDVIRLVWFSWEEWGGGGHYLMKCLGFKIHCHGVCILVQETLGGGGAAVCMYVN